MFSAFFGVDKDSGITLSKRKGVSQTLHRVSLITHPMRLPEKVIGVTVRVGRAMQGLIETMAYPKFLFDLAKQQQSLLLIGKPGVGKVRQSFQWTCWYAMFLLFSNNYPLVNF